METIDITPTWRDVARIIAAVLENGTEAGKLAAWEQLNSMAMAADDRNAATQQAWRLAVVGERLGDALKPFADLGNIWLPESEDDDSAFVRADDTAATGVTVGDLRNAARVYKDIANGKD
jgi:hypothetical protein